MPMLCGRSRHAAEGRSQFPADDGFSGSFLEFRIYSVALTAAQIRSSYDAGPDVVP